MFDCHSCRRGTSASHSGITGSAATQGFSRPEEDHPASPTPQEPAAQGEEVKQGRVLSVGPDGQV